MRPVLALSLTLALASAPLPALAQMQRLGFGAFGSNDSFGDGDDRWRSAALSISLLFGPAGSSTPPRRFGDMIEARLSGEVISPADIDNPNPDDRPYAVSLGFGLNTYMRRGDTDIRLGAELLFIGPQTGLDDLQTFAHRQIAGQPSPERAQDSQIGNTTYLALGGEVARNWTLGAQSRLRPFAEARIGDETLTRIGADFVWGGFGSDTTLLRDRVTGQLYQAQSSPNGLSFLVGADIAHVASSAYLPDSRSADLTSVRSRARLGLHWQRDTFALQYSVTYLSPEFDQQDGGQVIGSAGLQFAF